MPDKTRREVIKMAVAANFSEIQIIDPHVHVWKHDSAFPFAAGAQAPGFDAAPETLLQLMRANGVAKTVIIQVIHYRYDNSYLASVLKRYPEYFRGVCRVDPLDAASPDHLSRISEQPGFHGVRLSPAADATGDWISGPLMPPLWQRCQHLKAPMTLLTASSRIPEIGRLVERFPQLTVVIDHMADCPVDHPQELEKLVALVRYPRVFVKISHTWSLSKTTYPWMDSQRLVKRLCDTFGPKRLMWATDWPIAKDRASYAQRLQVIRDGMPFLNEDDKYWLLSGTVKKVWPF